jgi:hypothetical protein
MNGKQIIILICALVVSALIVWYDLPIKIPLVIFKVFMLFVKLSLVLALTVVAYIFAGRNKKAS